ncbi:flavin reductase family protein [Arthrobacter sp. I2-34]|uniref:Flavin reductase family protein n=1 Tax=Arthrobacter hankyongi TaxID=2904801 RepID=A0ABS9L7D9_9MICC|nr:flavin reductase family protein [Arthrobacter hankyongi]MCG2622579.1 flavin reductase family protein [Arthrobacter hankyongi]
MTTISLTDRTDFDPVDLRRSLGRFATGVTVITTRGADGSRVGMTANSFTSVSLDPPLLLFCIANTAPSLEHFRSSGRFAIHVLSAEQHLLSSQFARPAADKFAGLEVTEDGDGVPEIRDVLVRFACRTVSSYVEGDHTIVVGRVHSYSRRDGEPLVFFSGEYKIAQDHPEVPAR